MSGFDKIGFASMILRCISVPGKRSHYSRHICRHLCSKNHNDKSISNVTSTKMGNMRGFADGESSANDEHAEYSVTAGDNEQFVGITENSNIKGSENAQELGRLGVENVKKRVWKSVFKRYENAKFPVNKTNDQSFATMLRKSKFMQMGELKDVRVVGEIFEVNGDDLYIDFGGKFHCVCQRPAVHPLESIRYIRGAQVNLMLKSFEMSRAFLGSDKHITLLEADAVLLSLVVQPEEPTTIDPTTVPTFEQEVLVTHYGQEIEDVI